MNLTITITAAEGLRVAGRLFWMSLVALIRRDTITFEMSGMDAEAA